MEKTITGKEGKMLVLPRRGIGGGFWGLRTSKPKTSRGYQGFERAKTR